MENYTPVIVCAAAVALAAWKLGWLAKLRGPAAPPASRAVQYAPINQAPAAAVVLPNTGPTPTRLDEYDTATLGLAYQRAVKRDAEAALAAEMAARSHAESLARWQAPFAQPGGATGPPPAQAPQPPPAT